VKRTASTARDCICIMDVGKTHTRLLRLATSCIFVSPVTVDRKQEGCMRFSFVAAGSITPRRFQCQPDAANPALLPHFTSLRFGDSGYCQLRASTSRLIREGGEDGSEMGVTHALFQPRQPQEELEHLPHGIGLPRSHVVGFPRPSAFQ